MSWGIFAKYSTASRVSGSLYSPICPTLAAGTRLNTPSVMPRPALKIGTIANFLPAKRLAVILVTGVCISTSCSSKSLVTS